MSCTRFASIVTVALLLLSSACRAQDGAPETEYFPLKKGHSWTYAGPGDIVVEVKVIASLTVENSTYFTLETRMGGRPVGKTEDVTVNREKEGDKKFLCVYRGRVGDQPVNPPLRFLRVPEQAAAEDAKPDQWNVNSKIGKDEEIKGAFVVGKMDVEYALGKEDDPANKKKYTNCITVTSEKMTVHGQPIQFKYYFAPNVGLVRQEVTIDKVKVDLKLRDFKQSKDQ